MNLPVRSFMSSVKLYEGDCLEIMPTLPDKSVDMILCDLPGQERGYDFM